MFGYAFEIDFEFGLCVWDFGLYLILVLGLGIDLGLWVLNLDYEISFYLDFCLGIWSAFGFLMLSECLLGVKK